MKPYIGSRIAIPQSACLPRPLRRRQAVRLPAAASLAAQAGNPQSSRGFTLIELMVVIAILGILAALVAPSIIGRKEDANRAATKVQTRNFEQALKLFYVDNGFYPTTEQGLQALVEKPAIGRTPPKWREGGYLEGNKVPKDPWGSPFVYLSPGIHSKDYDILSYGADGQEGGEGKDADVRSWALDEN